MNDSGQELGLNYLAISLTESMNEQFGYIKDDVTDGKFKNEIH